MASKNEPKPREIPNNIEAEQALLGAIFMNNAAYSRVSDFLSADAFYEPVHRKMYDVIGTLISQNKTANPVTVKSFIPEVGKIGDLTVSEYMALLARSAVTVLNAPDYAGAINDMFLRRRLIDIGTDMVNFAYEADADASPEKQIDEASSNLYSISELNNALNGSAAFRGSAITTGYLSYISKDPTQKSKHGVPIALREMQTVLSETHFENKNLYGLLSSSGEGKTSKTLQIIWHALVAGHPVAFFSYDQTGEQCIAQMIAQETAIEVRVQKSGAMNDRQMERAVSMAGQIAMMPFEVFNCSSKYDNTDKLGAKAKGFMKRFANGKTPLFVFDHMGAIPPEFEDRKSDEGTKAKGVGNKLKSILKEMNAAGLVLQQRGGAGMARFNPRPIPSDLFGGEGARQPFDAIAYLFRGEEHMRRKLDVAKDERERNEILARFASLFPQDIGIDGIAEIGSLKVRFGKVGIRRYVKFIGEQTKYESLTPETETYQQELL